MQTMTKVHDPSKAKAYFADKLAFSLGPVELDRMIHSNDHIVVVDVRAADDYAKGHVPGAINLPRGKWDSFEGLQKDKTNVVYCYTQQCHLGAEAAFRFASVGYPVMEMEGGFEAWKENDLETEHEAVNRLKKSSGSIFQRR